MTVSKGVSPASAAVSAVLHLSVDRKRCQGHARCAALAPELFELDDDGAAHVRTAGAVPPHLHGKARLARANCPEFAVRITDGDCA